MLNLNSGLHPEVYKRIDHVAIAVLDLESAIALYQGVFGFKLTERRKTEGQKTGMSSAVLEGKDYTIVLVKGDNPESQVARYIENYGAGVQHVAFEVEDIEDVVAQLTQKGLEFMTKIINGPGLRQIFSVRDANSGMMIELIQRTDNHGFDDSSVNELFETMEAGGYY